MTVLYKKPDAVFYLAWIIFTVLCIPIAFILSLVLLFAIERAIGGFIYVDGVRHVTQDYLGTYIMPPIMGLVTGIVQYGLLRRYLPRVGWWVLGTVAGWLLGLLLILILPAAWMYESSWGLDLALVLLGLSIGIAQWLLLRQRLPRAGWWIGANFAGWGLFGLITGNPLDQFGLFALGILPACATAVTLAFLINQSPPPEPQGYPG